MGKGDRRTRKGKIFRGTRGKTRPRATKAHTGGIAVPVTKTIPSRAASARPATA